MSKLLGAIQISQNQKIPMLIVIVLVMVVAWIAIKRKR